MGSLRLAPPVATTAATTCVAIPCVPQHWRLLPRALRSITLQTRKANFIVVILSHVNEKSAECTQLRQMLKSWVPRARLACVHSGSGAATRGANRNRAVDLCRGASHVAFLDADDEMYPARLEVMLALMVKYNADLGLHSFKHVGATSTAPLVRKSIRNGNDTDDYEPHRIRGPEEVRELARPIPSPAPSKKASMKVGPGKVVKPAKQPKTHKVYNRRPARPTPASCNRLPSKHRSNCLRSTEHFRRSTLVVPSPPNLTAPSSSSHNLFPNASSAAIREALYQKNWQLLPFKAHQGHAIVRRSVLKAVPQRGDMPRGQDSAFVYDVLSSERNYRIVHTSEPLTAYHSGALISTADDPRIKAKKSKRVYDTGKRRGVDARPKYGYEGALPRWVALWDWKRKVWKVNETSSIVIRVSDPQQGDRHAVMQGQCFVASRDVSLSLQDERIERDTIARCKQRYETLRAAKRACVANAVWCGGITEDSGIQCQERLAKYELRSSQPVETRERTKRRIFSFLRVPPTTPSCKQFEWLLTRSLYRALFWWWPEGCVCNTVGEEPTLGYPWYHGVTHVQ